MKKNIIFVTYLREGERFPLAFIPLLKKIMKDYNLLLYIFCHSKILNKDKLKGIPYQIDQTEGTKYYRLWKLINQSTCNYIVSMDNDITPRIDSFVRLLNQTILQNKAIGFGKITIKNPKNLTEYWVQFMKRISHDLLRPFSFKMKFGISIPGQVMIINRKIWQPLFIKGHTFLDDLLMGVLVKEYRLDADVNFSKEIIGEEIPNRSLPRLLNQRKRWAKGFQQTLSISNAHLKSSAIYIKLHALTYEMSWIINWLFLIGLWIVHPLLSIVAILLEIIWLTKLRIKSMFFACLYLVAFPVLRISWLFYFLKNLYTENQQGDQSWKINP